MFLKGVSQINPLTVHRFPTWDLHLVLDGLTKKPLELVHQADHQHLTLKTLLLASVTSARGVSELGALRQFQFVHLHKDKVVLRPDPAFILKINTWFHRKQECVFVSFYPNTQKPLEPQKPNWHALDARRSLLSTT